MSQTRDVLYIALFLVLIIVLWAGLSLLPGPNGGTQGGYDIAAYDFVNTIYTTAPVWDSWPEKLYTPEELARAEAPVPHQGLDYTKVYPPAAPDPHAWRDL